MPRSSTSSADLLALLRLTAQGAEESRPGALERLLLALLACLLGRPTTGARATPLGLQWYFSPTSPHLRPRKPIQRHDEYQAVNRLLAWIGWILRGTPNRGMTPSGARPAPPRPIRAARAPPTRT